MKNYLDFYELLIKNERLIVFLFATILGTAARGVFTSVKGQVTRGNFTLRLVLALFVNYILQAIILNEKWLISYYGQVLALGAFLCWQVSSWIDKKLFNKVLASNGLEEEQK